VTRVLPRSLFGQVVLAQCLILAAVAIWVPVALTHVLGTVADKFVAERLHRDANRLAAATYHDAAGWHLRPGFRMGSLYGRDSGSRAFVLLDGHDRVLASSRGPFRIAVGNLDRPASDLFVHRGAADLLLRPLAPGPAGAWVIIGQDRTHPEVIVDDVVSGFLARLAWIIPATMLVSLLLGAWFVRRAVRGIQAVSDEADAIEPGRLDVRLTVERLPREAQPLARAANLALDRVEAGYRAQEEFVADVAHELRTPLALIALKAETVADPALKVQLREAVGRASHVISQLMELAFVENLEPGAEPVDLSAIALAAVETHAPLVFQSGRTIEFADSPAPVCHVTGSPGLIGIALANLVDNAVRHTRSGTHIVVAVRPEGAIAVVDDGPGIAAGTRGLARTRYWRADNRRTDSAGLGLAIVARIMAALGGTLALGQAPGGGASVVLTFKSCEPVRAA
jgi:signal transduction histidine kinase